MKAIRKRQIDAIYETAYDYPFLIAQDVGFEDVKKYPHNIWMKHILNDTDDYTLMAHRGSYKSSVLSVCIALLMVLEPEKNIIFLRKADNDVAEMIRMVKKALESKPFRRMSFILYGKDKIVSLVKSSESELTTNLYNSASGSSQLLGIGIKSSITGKHADIVITDDICNISDRISKAERERTKLQYQELQNIKNRGGRIINTGTKWHKEDFFSLIDNIDIYDYKKTKLISDEEIKAIKDKMAPSLFACNYELKIIAAEDVIFTDAVTDAPFQKILNPQVTHIDAAYGGEDYTAFTATKKSEGKYYIYGKLWHEAVDKVMNQIIFERHKVLGGKIWCEKNGDKGYLAKALREKGERVVDYNEDTNKYIKIVTHLKGDWKNVVFVEGTDPEYIEQILDYNEFAEHDDAPDSAACCIRILHPQKNAEDRVHSGFGY